MTLYLSQQKLLCLLIGAFLIGMITALIYEITGLFFKRKPQSRMAWLFWWLFLHLRDLLLFALLGVADAILLFVYHSGRVRISVFLLNLLGFLFCRMCLWRPFVALMKKIVCRFFIKKGSDHGEVI